MLQLNENAHKLLFELCHYCDHFTTAVCIDRITVIHFVYMFVQHISNKHSSSSSENDFVFALDPSLGVSDLMLSSHQTREHYQMSASSHAPDNVDIYRQPIHVG